MKQRYQLVMIVGIFKHCAPGVILSTIKKEESYLLDNGLSPLRQPLPLTSLPTGSATYLCLA